MSSEKPTGHLIVPDKVRDFIEHNRQMVRGLSFYQIDLILKAITQARREGVEKVMRLIDEFHAQQAGGMDYNQGLIDGQQALAVYIMNGLTDDDYLNAKERDGK